MKTQRQKEIDDFFSKLPLGERLELDGRVDGIINTGNEKPRHQILREVVVRRMKTKKV